MNAIIITVHDLVTYNAFTNDGFVKRLPTVIDRVWGKVIREETEKALSVSREDCTVILDFNGLTSLILQSFWGELFRLFDTHHPDYLLRKLKIQGLSPYARQLFREVLELEEAKRGISKGDT